MRSIRISLATIVALLISLGIVMVYSSSGVYALQNMGDSLYFVRRHIIFVSLGLLATIGVMVVDYRILRSYAKPFLIFTIILLVVVLIPGVGKKSFGAQRWFRLGLINFQPSELAKLTVLIYTADFLARKKGMIKSFSKGFFPLIFVLGLVSVFILKQPDLGNVVLIGVSMLIMMFIAGTQIKHLISLFLLTLPFLYFLVFQVGYRRKRILAFFSPSDDIQNVGFQLHQSYIALGSGGLWGVGLGKSMQKLFYLPAAHTDFIFSIVGEELGLLRGTLPVVMLFSAFIWYGARIAKRTQEPFGYFLCIGIIAMLGMQASVNIGVSIGMLPTKGLPLPFVSYGGSALIFNLISVGLLLNISRIADL